MGKCESATKNCLQLLMAAMLVSTLLVVVPVGAQPTSNTDVHNQFREMLNQGAGDEAVSNLHLIKLLQQRMLEVEQAEKELQQHRSPFDSENRLETRAAGGAKRYQGTRRIGGTIVLGR